jgi:hypothetical protein
MSRNLFIGFSSFIVSASFLLSACGSSNDSGAGTATTAPIATTVVPTRETTIATTTAIAETTTPPSTAVLTPETTATKAVAVPNNQQEPETLDGAVSQLVAQLTGQPPEAADIACISSKITMQDLELTATGTDTDSSAFRKVFGVIFDCNPKGLGDTFAKQTFTKTQGVTEVQRTCLGTKLVEIIAASPEIISAISTDAAKPPTEFVDGAIAAVQDCVADGPVRESLLAEISEG